MPCFRHVMENTEHTFLVGAGAERQAKLAGKHIVIFRVDKFT